MVFRRIGAPCEQVAASRLVPRDTGVVSGGDGIGAQSPGSIEQRGELQIAVAARAGQRRASRRVLADEVRDHLFLELALEIQDVVGDIDGSRHPPGVVQVVERAAAPECPLAIGLIVELHRQADDIVALFDQHGGGHR